MFILINEDCDLHKVEELTEEMYEAIEDGHMSAIDLRGDTPLEVVTRDFSGPISIFQINDYL